MPQPTVMTSEPLTDALRQMLKAIAEPVPWEPVPSDHYAHVVEGLVVYGGTPVTDALLERLPRVRVISNHGVGVDHIDLAAAARRGIPVGNTPEVLNGAVADAAWALLLAVARQIVLGDRLVRSLDETSHLAPAMMGTEVHGMTLGIVGMGRIGIEIARRAVGFSMCVLYHNRRRNLAAESSVGAQYCSLDELLTRSDFVIDVLPYNAATDQLFNAAAFTRMKPTSIFVNIGRGKTVDTQALDAALANGQLAGAGLDVTEPEPLPPGHPLTRRDNVVLTPHIGSATWQTRRLMAELTVENLRLGLLGQPLQHPVAVRLPDSL